MAVLLRALAYARSLSLLPHGDAASAVSDSFCHRLQALQYAGRHRVLGLANLSMSLRKPNADYEVSHERRCCKWRCAFSGAPGSPEMTC